MKILLATNWSKGNTGDFVYHAIKRMGHDLTLITPLECDYQEAVRVERDLDIVKFVEGMERKPDIFIYVECSIGGYFFPERVYDLPIPTAYWSSDTHFNFRWNKEWLGQFDYGFFSQLDWLNLAREYGYRNVSWLPYAADEEFHRDFGLERDIEVGYVGSLNDEKRRYFEMLKPYGIEVVTNKGRLTYEEIGKFYSRCKMVYNISARYDLNQRAFEAPASGALLVNQADVLGGLYEIFSNDENMVVHNFDDAGKLIRRMLDNDEFRQKLAERGKELVRSRHLYRHRVQTMIDACSSGISKRRKDEGNRWLSHLQLALVYQHPSFRLWGKSFKHLRAALFKNLFGSIGYLWQYLKLRVKEKRIKAGLKRGKAPY